MQNIRLESLYEHLLRGYVFDDRDEREFLTWMLLLHTHEVHLRSACVEDAPGITIIQPATQRAAADAIATIWGDREDRERISYRYWYSLYQTKKPYETVESLPAEEAQELRRIRERLESHPLVKAIVPQP